MAGVGRPTKLTSEVVNKLEEIFALDGTVEEACFFAGISRQTYYQWIKENPELNDRFEELRQNPFLIARRTVVKSLDNPDYAFKYLERKKRKEFGATVDVTTGGENINKISIEIINGTQTQVNETDGEQLSV